MLKNFLAGAGASSFVFGFYFYDHLKRSDRQIFNRIAILRKMIKDQGTNMRISEIAQPAPPQIPQESAKEEVI